MIRFILRQRDDSQPSTQLESPSFLICSIGEAVDSETQVRQDLVIDDVVKKDGVRIEGFLRQDDAIIE
jgi:hypothetical protein